MESPADIERRRHEVLRITEAQIEAAVAMNIDVARRGGGNWSLKPIPGTTRAIYRCDNPPKRKLFGNLK